MESLEKKRLDALKDPETKQKPGMKKGGSKKSSSKTPRKVNIF